MKLLSTRLFVIVSICSLSGCFIAPTSGDYYTPVASEGKVGGYGDYSDPTTLSVQRGNNISITISGFFLGGSMHTYVDNASIEIRLYIPEAESLEVDLTKVRIYDAQSIQVANVSSVFAMNRLGGHNLNMQISDKTFKGDTLPFKDATLYVIEAKLDSPPPTVVTVELPIITADGNSYPPLIVTFKKTHGWWWQFYG
jgi:hypothetical protein